MILGISIKRIDEFKDKEPKLWNYFWPPKISKKSFKVRNLNDLRVIDFADLERFSEDVNYIDFCNIFVRRKWWQTICIHNLPEIREEYARQIKEIQDLHEWTFNPPIFGEQQKETAADEYKKDFVKEFGSIAVLIEKVCGGRITEFKKVEQWKVSEFLFWADYLNGQRIIENIK